MSAIVATATETLLIIGVPTGGTEAVKEVLAQLAADSPGVSIAQHMPEVFV